MESLSSFGGSVEELSSTAQVSILQRLQMSAGPNRVVIGLSSIPDEITLEESRHQLRRLTLWTTGENAYIRGQVMIPHDNVLNRHQFEQILTQDNLNEVYLWAAGNSSYAEAKRYKQVGKKLLKACQRAGRWLFIGLDHIKNSTATPRSLEVYTLEDGSNPVQMSLAASVVRDQLELHARAVGTKLMTL
jgi:hypothetical protein